MKKYLAAVVVAVVIIGAWEGVRYVQALRAEAAVAHAQAAKGEQAFAYLAAVLAKDANGDAALTMGDALMQMVQRELAQAKAAQAQAGSR